MPSAGHARPSTKVSLSIADTPADPSGPTVDLRRAPARRLGTGRSFVRRDRVLRLLEAAGEVSVVCLRGPGGFGKTTVLTQWTAQDPRPVVWLTVRPHAADAAWLAQVLVQELYETGLVDRPVTLPTAPDAVAWHLGALPVVERAVASIAQPFLLVVDDVDTLHGDAWEQLAESVVRSLPAGAQLAVATRTELPATLRRLRAEDAVLTLGPDVLALDAVEGAELMRLLGASVTDDALLALLEETGGWPVAVHLAGAALRSGRQPGVVPALASASTLADYLREEILRPLPEDDARFLLRVSVLSQLDEATCDAVAGGSGSLARLRRLAATNHLLQPLDVNADRFHMRPLLASFLSGELRVVDPAVWRAAHAAAGAALERIGDLDGAVHHARRSGDDARLAALVWRYAGRLLASGRTPVLRRWLDGLPRERIFGQCGLSLAAARVAAQEGDVVAMSRFLLAAQACAAREGSDLVPDIELLKATLGTDGLDGMERCSRAFITARAATSPEDIWLSTAHFFLGVVRALRGRRDEAVAELEEANRLALVLDAPFMRVLCLALLAQVSFTTDEVARGLRQVREARELVVRHRLDHIATIAPFFTVSALGYVHEGRLPEAAHEAGRALRLSALVRSMAPWHAVQGRLTLANVFFAVGDVQSAAAMLEEAAQLHGPQTASPVLDEALRATRERVVAARSSAAALPGLTTAEVRVLQFLPTHLSFPEIASELFVSRHTVKTQALSAYRKLGAHNRTEAIEMARELGLLPLA